VITCEYASSASASLGPDGDSADALSGSSTASIKTAFAIR
jgi:hypothetical protein